MSPVVALSWVSVPVVPVPAESVPAESVLPALELAASVVAVTVPAEVESAELLPCEALIAPLVSAVVRLPSESEAELEPLAESPSVAPAVACDESLPQAVATEPTETSKQVRRARRYMERRLRLRSTARRGRFTGRSVRMRRFIL